MDINDLMVFWNHANCKVIDIRRTTISAGESIRSYSVPSNLFLMSVRGKAKFLCTANVCRSTLLFQTLGHPIGCPIILPCKCFGEPLTNVVTPAHNHPRLP